MVVALVIAAAIALSAPVQTASEALSRDEPAPTVVSLEDALRRAQARAPSLDAARERLRAAADALSALSRSPNPVIELRGENFGPSSRTLPRDLFATISQPIELGGKRTARRQLLAATGVVMESDLDGVQQALALDVVTSYLESLRWRQASEILAAQLQSVSVLVGVLGERVREGVAAERDLRRFETEHARIETQLARAEAESTLALARLSAVVGERLDASRLLTPDLPSVASAAKAETTLARRPDVRAAASRVTRATAAAAVERARGVPDLTVTSGYKRTAGFDSGVAAITMPIPIFDRNRSAIVTTAAEVRAARLELDIVRRRAQAEAEARADVASRLSALASRVADDLIVPADVVRTAARSAFLEGRGDVLQLVDAERAYADAAREAGELQLDALLAAIQSRLSSGAPPLP